MVLLVIFALLFSCLGFAVGAHLYVVAKFVG